MKEMFLKAILAVDDTMNTVIMILAIVSGVLSIVAEFRNQSEKRKNSWVIKFIIIVSIGVIACTFVRKSITQVPNVVGKTYQDACNILSDNGLNYNLVLDNGVYVMEQNPAAGTIVEKNFQVELVTEPIGNNAEVKRIWEESLNVSYGNVAVTFKDTNIILEDAGKTVQCYGNVLKDYTVKKAYLLEKTVGVEYHDYILQDNVMIFKNIPQGIAAMINFVEGFTPEQNEEAMTEALSEVKSGQVTYAVRDTVIDGKEIKAGNIMGLSDKTIEIVGTDVVDTTIDLLKKMMDEESELITIYYGEEGTKEDAEKIAKAIEGIDDEMEVEIQYGGQPIYYYFVSVE